MAQRPPNLTEKYAGALLEILRLSGEAIPYEVAKAMTPAQIISLFQSDHYPVRRETALALSWDADAVNHPSNLRPRLILAHRHKSAKRDMPEIKHGRRVTEAQEEHRRKMLAKAQGEKPKSAWGRSKMAGSRRSKWKKKINGRVVPRRTSAKAEMRQRIG